MGLIFDAVRVRLIEIGEAVKAITPELLAREPAIPWADIAGMRDHLAHRYVDTAHAIVAATVEHDLPPLLAATKGSSSKGSRRVGLDHRCRCWSRGCYQPG